MARPAWRCRPFVPALIEARLDRGEYIRIDDAQMWDGRHLPAGFRVDARHPLARLRILAHAHLVPDEASNKPQAPAAGRYTRLRSREKRYQSPNDRRAEQQERAGAEACGEAAVGLLRRWQPASRDKARGPNLFCGSRLVERVGARNQPYSRGHPARIDGAELASGVDRERAHLFDFCGADVGFDLLLVTPDRLSRHAGIRKRIPHPSHLPPPKPPPHL